MYPLWFQNAHKQINDKALHPNKIVFWPSIARNDWWRLSPHAGRSFWLYSHGFLWFSWSLFKNRLLFSDTFVFLFKTRLLHYRSHPANHLTSASLAWHALLLNARVELNLIRDPDIKRGGLRFACWMRCAKAKSESVGEHDENNKARALLTLTPIIHTASFNVWVVTLSRFEIWKRFTLGDNSTSPMTMLTLAILLKRLERLRESAEKQVPPRPES